MRFYTIKMIAMLLVMASATAYCKENIPRQFAFGAYHQCALTAEGAVQCLGQSNRFGQIGDGQSIDAPTFRPIQIIARGATALAVGDFFSCAIVDGALDCWGDFIQSGHGNNRPTRMISSGVTQVAAGNRHACAIVNGSVQCWGSDFTGESGNGDYQNGQPTPWTVIKSGASGIAAGDEQSCAIVKSALWCWGRTGLERDPRDVAFGGGRPPIKIIEDGVTAVATGAEHTCAIVKGALWCWGDNSNGQVGIGISVGHAERSPGMPPKNTLGEFIDGEQLCFSNYGVTCRVIHPVKVIADGVTAVAARYNQTCAVVSGALQCWGNNRQGQLGIDSAGADVVKPTPIVNGSVSYIAIGNPSTCVLLDGTLRCSKKGKFDSTDSPFGISSLEARLGVWQGVIGDQKVMVCLERSPGDSSYYYLRHKLSIALTATSEQGTVWTEGTQDKDGPTWNLQLPEGDRLEGKWMDADGKRNLPIRLSRIARKAGQELGCDNDGAEKVAFNAPRVASQKLTIKQSSGGYRSISAFEGNVSWVELQDSKQGSVVFNKAMRKWFDGQVADYYWCALQTNSGGFSQERTIMFYREPWLVLKDSYDEYCGGAHPSSGIAGYEIWNLEKGRTIELWDLIRGSKLKDGYGYAAPVKLNAIILANATRNKNGDECTDSVNENNSYLLHPGTKGLVFSTSFAHVIQACDEDIEVPYSKLQPFLTTEGKLVVKSLMEDRPSATAK